MSLELVAAARACNLGDETCVLGVPAEHFGIRDRIHDQSLAALKQVEVAPTTLVLTAPDLDREPVAAEEVERGIELLPGAEQIAQHRESAHLGVVVHQYVAREREVADIPADLVELQELERQVVGIAQPEVHRLETRLCAYNGHRVLGPSDRAATLAAGEQEDEDPHRILLARRDDNSCRSPAQ